MESGSAGGGEAASCGAEMAKYLPSKLKIAGFWAGGLDVDLETWTLSALRQEIGRRSNFPADAIKMICGGKVLADDQGSKTLIELGIKNNAKILITRVKLDEVKAFNDAKLAEEERTRRLARIREAVSSLAEKHTNESLAGEDFTFEVESLSGQKVELGTDSDRRAIMMGLMLHSNGKHLIKQAKYKEALDVLAMGEEAFSLCDPKIVEMMDNVSILQIDMVWCYFMLRDISCLSVAGVRLDKVRKSIDPKKFDHANLTLEDQHLQRITYLRLELLEGVVAYHCGRYEESRKTLASAQAKYLQFQVSDEGLTKLMNLGYQRRAAKRALIICGQDIENAANFLIEERTKRARRMEADRQRIEDTREQKSYGLTPKGKLVSAESLTVLTSLGIEKRIAAEALRRAENDVQRALDDVTNPDTHCDIQVRFLLT
ncbi:unnamed protein product [Victoria cruziana]